ncbi:hypothetical protein GCM10017673_53190 [Streptosporangium violaceochromogenes]|nr:hypothetical protein GCM10017673_53190 [Streptosporangium violaceochromogenes]
MIDPFLPPPRPLRPVRGMAVAVLVTLGVAVLAQVVWLLAEPAFFAKLIAIAEESGTEGAFALVALVPFAVLLPAQFVAAVAFVLWLIRVRLNAESLSRVPHRWSKIFIVLGWLLPVVNWWIPKQIVDDVWVFSWPDGTGGGPTVRRGRSPLIWAWWMSWLLAFWVLPVASRALASDEIEELLEGPSAVDVATLACTVMAAVLAGMVVLRITRLQESRLAPSRG